MNDNKFKLNDESKRLFGEVKTPFFLIEEMLNLFSPDIFKNPNLKWLDIGCGTGNFVEILLIKLDNGLKSQIKNDKERLDYIMKNMIYMVEIQEENCNILKEKFSKYSKFSNIIKGDFLLINKFKSVESFDCIIGNPPFNFNGLKKVPTNNYLLKENDGKTIWKEFIIHSLKLLKNKGNLCIFIPSIWLKPDKDKIYYLLTRYYIKYLHCLSNTSTNKIFKGSAQTPCCYFLLKKEENKMNINEQRPIKIWDYQLDKYFDFKKKKESPIPVFGIGILNKFIEVIDKNNVNTIKVKKTNSPPKGTNFSEVKSFENSYLNIKTTKFDFKTKEPKLIIEYSDKKLPFHGEMKLVLSHKMYGIPFLDKEGLYGISNRDNYIIKKDNIEDLIKLQKFLSCKTILYLFECTRYRMKFLEKYIFDYIPDISLLSDFPSEINENSIQKYFNLDEEDIKNINKFIKRDYKFFI